jgi:hypothetical protein
MKNFTPAVKAMSWIVIFCYPMLIIPFVEPYNEAPLLKGRAQRFHRRFVFAVVAKENVEAHNGR